MTDIPRWPKISLLDAPDEEERAKRQLNESRRKRGLEPLYPEAGFPHVPSFAELLIGGRKPIPLGGYPEGPPEPEKPDPDPEFYKDPKDLVIGEANPGEGQLAQTEPPLAASDGQQGVEAAPPTLLTGGYELAEVRDPNQPERPPSTDANASTPGKPLTYAQIKRLVRENNHSKLPDEMIIAIIFKESSFDPSAVSKHPDSTETGLMQINKRGLEKARI